MIREFLSKRRIVFFPKSWANSITQWICGIHSPSGTLKIVNTANPSKGKSASLDVDIDAVWERLRERIESLRREDDGQKLRDSKDETFEDKILAGSHEDLTHYDITDWDSATAGFLDVEDYNALSGAIDDLSGVVDDILSEMSSFLTVGDVGVTVASKDHTHDEYLTEADLNGYALEDDLLDLAEEVVDIDLDILDLTESLEMIIDDIYDESGNLNFVTRDTEQWITGAKYFGKAGIKGSLNNDPSFDFYSDDTTPRGRFSVDSQGVHFTGYNGGAFWIDTQYLLIRGGSDTGIIGSVQFRKSDGTIGSYIEGLYDGPRFVSVVGANIAFFDARLSADGTYHIVKNGGNEPADDSTTASRELAVRGWVNEHFPRKPSDSQLYTGDADIINDIQWDGTLLKYHKIRVSYYNGLYKSGYSDLGWTTIDTPTLYTPT